MIEYIDGEGAIHQGALLVVAYTELPRSRMRGVRALNCNVDRGSIHQDLYSVPLGGLHISSTERLQPWSRKGESSAEWLW